MFKQLHHKFVFLRRIKILSRELSSFIDPDIKSILDIGSGDGTISKLIQDCNPGLKIFGIDIMERPYSSIIFRLYDGKRIPFDDNRFDICMLVDVLHHSPHIKELLTEARRVSGKYILIKDHLYKTSFDFKTLKFMDNVGNKPHGVVLEYNYLMEKEWEMIFNDLELVLVKKKTRIPLYPFPFNLIFGRKLHFISLLKVIK
jgi:SAM-dependent methyltransferase